MLCSENHPEAVSRGWKPAPLGGQPLGLWAGGGAAGRHNNPNHSFVLNEATTLTSKRKKARSSILILHYYLQTPNAPILNGLNSTTRHLKTLIFTVFVYLLFFCREGRKGSGKCFRTWNFRLRNQRSEPRDPLTCTLHRRSPSII